ncbi:16S rRNA (uracil(1498)-N(3))-methyltransferase [Candidatus Pelagibacter sp.]|nr:16S rRNA (uracil(1498)-N(3))-methyltransferase [Candidatus Pelagibacter sp.]
MNNIRLFFSKSLSINLTAKLDKSQSHYVNKVMRVKVNQVFSLFNSSGEWEAKIKNISKNIVEFNITKHLRQKENLKEIWLAFSPIKSNYLNFMIQKATELGVTKFLPIIFDRTVVRKINKDRLEKIIIEASEQSNRINISSIENAQNLKKFLYKYKDKIELIFTDLNTQNIKLDVKKLSKKPICLIIGPEGDFSENERQEILSFDGVKPIKINKNILRSETAAVSSISIISYLIDL